MICFDACHSNSSYEEERHQNTDLKMSHKFIICLLIMLFFFFTTYSCSSGHAGCSLFFIVLYCHPVLVSSNDLHEFKFNIKRHNVIIDVYKMISLHGIESINHIYIQINRLKCVWQQCNNSIQY